MYLYIGQDTVVNTEDIVGIFDLENTSVSKTTRNWLNREQKKDHIVAVSSELPKSFVICEREGMHLVYLSQISPATLKKRAVVGYGKGMSGFK